jgi:hypothetical protein
MKLKITPSIIENGHPHIEVLGPITQDDLVISENIVHREDTKTVTVTVVFTPNENLIKAIDECHTPDMVIRNYFVTSQGVDYLHIPAKTQFAYEEKVLYYDHRGMKTKKSKEEQIVKILVEAKEKVLPRSIEKGLTNLNRSLVSYVNRNNFLHSKEMSEFFRFDRRYVDYWDEVFSESPEYCTVRAESDILNEEIRILQKKARKKEKELRKMEYGMACKKMESFTIHETVRQEVLKEMRQDIEDYYEPEPFQ